ncbi:MAG: type VI secretion system ATPase TssH [Verrucomicrobiales bacterium]|nr:type VI secretion system ATPase TssH [Verrucomicrobiales bacterium]
MADLKIKLLLAKLNPVALDCLTSAVESCRRVGNPRIEPAHWLEAVLELQDTDVRRILANAEISFERVAKEVTRYLENLRRVSGSQPVYSADLNPMVRDAWLYASVVQADAQIRTGHLLVALRKLDDDNNYLSGVSPALAALDAEAVIQDWGRFTAGSPEETLARSASNLGGEFGGGAPSSGGASAAAAAAAGKQQALASYSEDITAKAREGKIDPIVGRDEEIRQIVDILMRRRQNNPILVGEAGVGKTAVVEGFALKIASGDVPDALKGVSLRSLDLARLQAGASMKGEFENRLKQVVDEVKAAGNVILFIDEAHTLIGAGGSAGQGDAANLIKPALARGELRTVAATTWAEYKKFFEGDAALTRRFQTVAVDEPSEVRAVRMIRSLAPVLEKHHDVLVFDEALTAAVRMSHRYIPSRQLPDKAVSVLDTSCARVAISQKTTPGSVEDLQRLIAALEHEAAIIQRETAQGLDHTKRAKDLADSIAREKARLKELEERWTKEKALVEQIKALRARLTESESAKPAAPEVATEPAKESKAADPAETPAPADPAAIQKDLRAAEADLVALQGEKPLVLPVVDERAVASVIADWTGIPVGRMVKDEIRSTLDLAGTLRRRILGQDHALEMIARRIRTAQARLEDPNKPIGAFLLVGPSGVGKTETALALAEARFGSERNAVIINMNEFKEEHTASTLIGAPPGYVGFGQGGVLTEAVRRRPYCVVLLDEFEKGHSSIRELFMQILDKGWIKDREGRYVDFRNTIVLLTTNAASDELLECCKGQKELPSAEVLVEAIHDKLREKFTDALLGRLVPIPYYPLDDKIRRLVIGLKLGRVRDRLRTAHEVELTYGEPVVDYIAEKSNIVELGGRVIDNIITNSILPDLGQALLARLMDEKITKTATITVEGEHLKYELT